MKVKANGINFNCKIEGKRGAPWLVFSNSLMTDLSMWDDQAAALGDKFQILRYDQRGHGGTDAPEGKYSFDVLVDRKSTRLNSSHLARSRMPSSA